MSLCTGIPVLGFPYILAGAIMKKINIKYSGCKTDNGVPSCKF